MNQTRRGFLATLAGAIASAAALGIDDPEKLLWVPGQKTIFIPEPPPTIVLPPEPKPLATLFEIGGPIYENGPRLYSPDLYSRDRYRITTGGKDVVFDSNWKPTQGWDRRERRAFTDEERAQLARDMADTRTFDMRQWRVK